MTSRKRQICAAIDTNMLVRSLCTDKNYKAQNPGCSPIPSAVRKGFASLVENNKVTWLIHQEHLEEMLRVLRRVVDKSGSRETRFNDDEKVNAQEMLSYVERLHDLLCGNSNVIGVEYMPKLAQVNGKPFPGKPILDLACMFFADVSERIRAQSEKDTDPTTDIVMALHAFHKARELRLKTGRIPDVYIITSDRDFEAILGAFDATLDDVRTKPVASHTNIDYGLSENYHHRTRKARGKAMYPRASHYGW